MPVKSVTKVKNNMKPEEELMNNTDLIFTITIEDMQQIAINGSIGRELTDEELQKIKTNMNPIDFRFTITSNDMHDLFKKDLGRELTDEELQKIKTNMNANLSHYAEIALKLALELE